MQCPGSRTLDKVKTKEVLCSSCGRETCDELRKHGSEFYVRADYINHLTGWVGGWVGGPVSTDSVYNRVLLVPQLVQYKGLGVVGKIPRDGSRLG